MSGRSKAPKDIDIYPKFEFRLSHKDKAWLVGEMKQLKTKFNEGRGKGIPSVSRHAILVAALRHGIRYLKAQKKISAKV